MSDQDETTQGHSEAAAAAPGDSPAGTPEGTESAPEGTQRVPLDRFRAVTDENKTLRDELKELREWREQQEEAQLSELERERKAREQAEKDLADAQTRATTLERSQWVKDAALVNGFADPDDAVHLISIGELDDQDSARAAVTELAERKPHLLRQQNDGPRPMGGAPAAPRAESSTDDPKAAMGMDILRRLQR